mmetsp:Transcript_2703/g.8874  ORF Transcript_2703/g.8874 Transcript_2703/m.8874 type:complete len:82 (+) Transcript_2703:581-826(+)
MQNTFARSQHYWDASDRDPLRGHDLWSTTVPHIDVDWSAVSTVAQPTLKGCRRGARESILFDGRYPDINIGIRQIKIGVNL